MRRPCSCLVVVVVVVVVRYGRVVYKILIIKLSLDELLIPFAGSY